MKARRKCIAFVTGVLLALYCLGYVGVRLSHQLVHYISCNDSGNYAQHDVIGGYAPVTGEGLNAPLAGFYTPLRYVELGWWHLAHPLGSPLTADQKRSFDILPATDSPPAETKDISWDQAVELIKSGQVTAVIQTHSLYVGLCATNGIWYHTMEPGIDEVFLLTRQHASNKVVEITE